MSFAQGGGGGQEWEIHRFIGGWVRGFRVTMQFMSPNSSGFTPLERAVFRTICETHPHDREALENQLATGAVLSRENTGHGFFTDFAVDRTATPAIGGERLRQGPGEAKIDGLEHGMGFVLWLEEGYADCLEGYCYGEDTSGIDFGVVGFGIL